MEFLFFFINQWLTFLSASSLLYVVAFICLLIASLIRNKFKIIGYLSVINATLALVLAKIMVNIGLILTALKLVLVLILL